MKVEVVTLFPEFVEQVTAWGVTGRAVERGLLSLRCWNPRDYAQDRHRTVDDRPYGGGPGMVMKVEPFVRAAAAIAAEGGTPKATVLLSPQGRLFTQAEARRLAGLGHVALLCGRYEGIDERVRDVVATEELSIGDYVLSGGELPALVVIDAVSRLIPGVVGDEQSVEQDSFSGGVLDYPHYTRPAESGGLKVPDVLLSGHHAEVRRWRRKTALERTLERRPDLLDDAALDDEDRALLNEIRESRAGSAEIGAGETDPPDRKE